MASEWITRDGAHVAVGEERELDPRFGSPSMRGRRIRLPNDVCTPLPCRDTCSPGEALGPMLTGVCSA